ncbi:hypothetical protein KSF_102680 [Reticulibacter mediterranei]|uniref:Uncharacterized protein n=1 Tax=Reticulibacter mediterranei TaxID=2778369 RepID=A0A8J3IXC6_9CHLR|nr:hypothetical protein KSF_102680 [Reticulibacter mediterranei]
MHKVSIKYTIITSIISKYIGDHKKDQVNFQHRKFYGQNTHVRSQLIQGPTPASR